MFLCKCGKVLKTGEKCRDCYPIRNHAKTTKERGYGSDHKQASERWRTSHPLCERCVMVLSVLDSNASEHLHHVIPIANDASRRMDSGNWLALCKACHELVEGDAMQGMKIRRWSDQHYENKLNEGLGHHG